MDPFLPRSRSAPVWLRRYRAVSHVAVISLDITGRFKLATAGEVSLFS